MLIFVFGEEEIAFCGVVRPDVLYALIELAFVVQILQIFDDFDGRARADSVINQLVARGGPRGMPDDIVPLPIIKLAGGYFWPKSVR